GDDPREDRVVDREELGPEPLAVAAPELLAGPAALHRTDEHAGEYHAHRVVEPDDRVRARPDDVARAAVIAVEHPTVLRDGLRDAPAEDRSRRLGPVGLPMQRVELDVRKGKTPRQLARERGLPRTGCAQD